MRPSRWELQGALGDRPPSAVEGWEALEELADELDGAAAQVGGVGGGEGGEPGGDAPFLARQALERLVDERGGNRLARPVHRQLDGAVGDRPPSAGRGPRERLVSRPHRLAREHPFEAVLADGQLRGLVTHALAELGQAHLGVVAELGHEFGVERHRRRRPGEQVEGVLLQRRQHGGHEWRWYGGGVTATGARAHRRRPRT